MPEATPSPYDAVHYEGSALAQAHPDRLATLAKLFGMRHAEVADCRVLELGCGDATHLTSVALSLPRARCVGIDLAAAGIEKGRRRAEQLALANLTLLQRDLVDLEPDFGPFDFIIAHGLYSWVPPAVQHRLLAVTKANLAEHGIAYVSYNVYPGCHQRDLVRGMMRYHVQGIADAQQRVAQARALMRLLADAQKHAGPYARILDEEMVRFAAYTDAHLFHDDLADCNAPVYFHQFAAHAARHGLRYLCEAHLFEMQAGIFPPDVAAALCQIPDRIAREQYLDFLKCRPFRQTLLCHQQRAPEETPRPERMAQFYVAAPLRPQTPDPDLVSDREITFLGPKGSSLRARAPYLKAALAALGDAWPRAIHFSGLLRAAPGACARDPLGDSGATHARALAELLLRAYAGAVVELHTHPPEVAPRPGQRPLAGALARLQCTESNKVTSLRHRTITLEEPLDAHLLELLDGTRNREELIDELLGLVRAGTASVQKDGQRVSDARHLRRVVAQKLEERLAAFARHALLVR